MKQLLRIMAVNGSHRAEKGICDLLLKTFLKGAVSEGAESRVIYPSKLTIQGCRACYHCLFNTPGTCFQNDDMAAVLHELNRADLLILAAPVYFDTMPGSMKMMFDRFMPLLGTDFAYRQGRTYHCPAAPRPLKVITLSVCGNPEKESLNTMGRSFRRMIDNMGWQLIGELAFPAAHLILSHPDRVKGQLRALARAGQEAVSEKAVHKETLARANQSYIDSPEAIVAEMNQAFQAMKNQNPGTGQHRGFECNI